MTSATLIQRGSFIGWEAIMEYSSTVRRHTVADASNVIFRLCFGLEPTVLVAPAHSHGSRRTFLRQMLHCAADSEDQAKVWFIMEDTLGRPRWMWFLLLPMQEDLVWSQAEIRSHVQCWCSAKKNRQWKTHWDRWWCNGRIVSGLRWRCWVYDLEDLCYHSSPRLHEPDWLYGTLSGKADLQMGACTDWRNPVWQQLKASIVKVVHFHYYNSRHF